MAKLTEADGRQLAVDLLRELQDFGYLDEYLIQGGTGRLANNVALRFLDTVRDSAELRLGFAAVLTDFISGAYHRGVTDPEAYEGANLPARPDV
jgi:hypothetical protein